MPRKECPHCGSRNTAKILREMPVMSHELEKEEQEACYFRFEIGGFFEGTSVLEIEQTQQGPLVSIYQTRFREHADAMMLLRETELQEFFHKIFSMSQLLEWDENYCDPNIMDGTQWSVVIGFTDRTTREWSGSNAYPPLWKQFKKEVDELKVRTILGSLK